MPQAKTLEAILSEKNARLKGQLRLEVSNGN
jgi:hypothetical protein